MYQNHVTRIQPITFIQNKTRITHKCMSYTHTHTNPLKHRPITRFVPQFKSVNKLKQYYLDEMVAVLIVVGAVVGAVVGVGAIAGIGIFIWRKLKDDTSHGPTSYRK